MLFSTFPHYPQYDEMDCGPTCLRIISKYYGKLFSLEYFRKLSNTTRAGSSLRGLSEAARQVGFQTQGVRIEFDALAEKAPFPCIAFWRQRHFVIVYKVKKDKVYVSDPAHGLLTYSREEFLKHWAVNGDEGVVLTLDTTPAFAEVESDLDENKEGLRFIAKYLLNYKALLLQLFIGLLVASLLQLIFPFLTQSLVDIGIQQYNPSFIHLILLAQMLLFLGRTAAELLRGHILIHLSSRISINLLSDFFIKLMKLPLGYFDVKMTGDILQRIGDHQRVELFLTSGTLNAVFSAISLLVFGVVLLIYSPLIFGVFLVFSVVYFMWVLVFMGRRAKLDFKRFAHYSQQHEKNLEMIHGMQEIKLHNAEQRKRWQWEALQAKLFQTSLDSLRLSQVQTGGASLINELKNILITFLAVKLVLTGQLTLGVMLSISYIVGQLNGPILQIVEFIKSWQDARLSIGRINEIHRKDDEEVPTATPPVVPTGDLRIQGLTFQYESGSEPSLQDINLVIPHQKVTAIVGASGSGKTTLLKLLLRFYEPGAGHITVADQPLADLGHSNWRDKCGAVMQEGYIFNDTIVNNIAVREEEVDLPRVLHAVQVANIRDYIEALPLRYNTRIGQNGMGLSTGQKQRILIARAVYKNPEFLFFDEATSALDAKNERIISENLSTYFKQKTVLVIAHRLSTVKNADQIIVLEKGRIVEVGDHAQLIQRRGVYFSLVKNQLELGD
ncbi:peptidase domain-containing ABC transporter [Hymenobacter terrestris]|uniref:Peptidase domain-containing ABC transporter n=1 Tax=Hymenobacter terrestris TaxID=2748310 RepID=A0ABX2Q7Z3_9BACT|nr:peptidase domain-containing ABC transporter [Hymenobacter terrestris]NVO85872.1 peptidase domain-containing ABC transporter [Hymenobacter terrestris]